MIGNVDEAIGAWKEVLGDTRRSELALRALDCLFQKGLASSWPTTCSGSWS